MRRMMMAMQEGEGKMTEWKTLYEETLTEDKNIILTDINCTEVEAYIISSGYDTTENIYLTSKANGTIYGDPRIYHTAKTTPYIMHLGLSIVAPYIVRATKVCVPYHNDSAGQNVMESILHSSLGQVYDLQTIAEISLAAQNLLKAGDRIYIRGR